MAFRLSLITSDIRKRMAEAVKEEKIHNKERAYITTNDYKEREKNQYSQSDKKGKKRYLTIDAVKNNKETLNVDAEIDKDVLNDESLGVFIDKKK